MKRTWILIVFVFSIILNGCHAGEAAQTKVSPAQNLVLYNWADYIPQAVLDAFTAEYGVTITYLSYSSMEEAITQLKSGQRYDVVVLKNNNIKPLASQGYLAPLNYHTIPNFKNISANFRDLALDPDNQYSIPFDYGTTGLLVRTDLVGTQLTRWSDLWDANLHEKIAVRPLAYELIGVALKSLGYSLNSEDPKELEFALQHLYELKPSLVFVDDETDKAIPALLNGQAAIMVGWSNDAVAARQGNNAVTYVLPEEGTLLWGESFVIPASSQKKDKAELFLNFVLRPEISAQIVNYNHYATANQAAYPFIETEVFEDQIIFPPADVFRKADWYLPLSPNGEKLYAEIWERFLAGRP